MRYVLLKNLFFGANNYIYESLKVLLVSHPLGKNKLKPNVNYESFTLVSSLSNLVKL